MDAIVLAGGFGTRLSQVLPDVPKPMAPINEKPFLAYLLTYLAKQGMRRIVLPVHYKREQIMDYFGDHYQGMSIDYVIEELSKEYEGKAVIGKLNVDLNPDVSIKYGITSIPAILFIKGGKVVDKQVGAVPKNVLEAKIKAHL